MVFPYARVLYFPKHQKRTKVLPWVRVGIANPKDPENVVYPLGLVDSGSELSIVVREIGEKLGFEVEKGARETIRGVGGGSVPVFVHKASYRIENPDNPKDIIKYSDYVAFTKNVFPTSYPQQTGIFGTIGFFKHLLVTFIFPEKIIIESRA